jgi:putative transposase
MKQRLRRRYGLGQLHFITCSCYRRVPLLGTERARHLFLKILSEVRERHDFALIGYVVMPEHIHLLISEPNVGDPSTVMQVLKQRVSRTMHRRRRRRTRSEQKWLWEEAPVRKYQPFWQRRFYDFNVWSAKKKEREDELHALQSGEERAGETSEGLGLEQLSFLFQNRNESVRAESGVEAENENLKTIQEQRQNTNLFCTNHRKDSAPTRVSIVPGLNTGAARKGSPPAFCADDS